MAALLIFERKEGIRQRLAVKAGCKAGYKRTPAFSGFESALNADRFRGSLLGLLLVAAVLIAWAAWFFYARITLYEITDKARLEIISASHPVEAQVAGRVVALQLVLGQEVRAGDILVEIDAEPQELQRKEEVARRVVLDPQLSALHDEMAAVTAGLEVERQAVLVSQDQARAQLREAEEAARFAALEAERIGRMNAAGLVPELDFLRAKSDAEKRLATVDSLRISVQKLEQDQKTRESDRKTRLEQLKRQVTEIEGQIVTVTAAIRRVEQEIERRRIRAPVSGRLGEVAELRVGMVVAEGTKLATVVPAGRLKVIADFLPPAALGRVRPGQTARLRLQGFPWMQYGSVPAVVTGVSSEVRSGMVRVELEVRPAPGSSIPLQHGLPGTVEVDVERISPAMLVMRAAGTLLARPSASPAAAGPAGEWP